MHGLLAAGIGHESTLRSSYVREDGTAIDEHVRRMLADDLARTSVVSRGRRRVG